MKKEKIVKLITEKIVEGRKECRRRDENKEEE